MIQYLQPYGLGIFHKLDSFNARALFLAAVAAAISFCSPASTTAEVDYRILMQDAKKFAAEADADFDAFEDWLLKLPDYCSGDKQLSRHAKAEMARSLLMISEGRHYAQLIKRAQNSKEVPIGALKDAVHGIVAHKEKFINPLIQECRRVQNKRYWE